MIAGRERRMVVLLAGGAEYCKRGIKKEGIVIITETRWVECDGKRTEC